MAAVILDTSTISVSRAIICAAILSFGLLRDAQAQTSIRLVDLVANQEKTLASGGMYRRPAISEDGTRVAYQGRDSSGYYIEIVGVTGESRRRYSLAHEPFDAEMRWSPNGKHLAFRADPQGAHSSRLQLIDTNSGTERTLVPSLVEQFVWRDDSRALRYVEHGQVHTVLEQPLDGGSVVLRVLEATVPDIGGIQFYNFSGSLVGSRSAGVLIVPLPHGTSHIVTESPRRGRVTALRDGRVAVPLNDPMTAIEVVTPGSSRSTIVLPFAMTTYFVGSLPSSHLIVAATGADSGAAVYSVTMAGESQPRLRAPPGTTIDWFDVSPDGRYLVVTVIQKAAGSRWR